MYSGLTRMVTVRGESGRCAPSSVTETTTSPGAVAFHVAATSPVSGSNVGALVIDARVVGDTETTNRDASDGATAAGFPRASLGVIRTGRCTRAAAPSSAPNPPNVAVVIGARPVGAPKVPMGSPPIWCVTLT